MSSTALSVMYLRNGQKKLWIKKFHRSCGREFSFFKKCINSLIKRKIDEQPTVGTHSMFVE